SAQPRSPSTEQAPTSSAHAFRTLRKTRRRLALIAVLLLEPARRPIVFRSVAAARAVERGDVLQRHEDVAVQLDVSDILDVAVRGQHALLVFPTEKGDLDLLAFVLVRVVLDARERSRSGLVKRVVNVLFAVKRVLWCGPCRLASPTTGGDPDVGARCQIRGWNCRGPRGRDGP